VWANRLEIPAECITHTASHFRMTLSQITRSP
jgi:hypothetical protein